MQYFQIRLSVDNFSCHGDGYRAVFLGFVFNLYTHPKIISSGHWYYNFADLFFACISFEVYRFIMEIEPLAAVASELRIRISCENFDILLCY